MPTSRINFMYCTSQANPRSEICMAPVLTKLPVLRALCTAHLQGHAILVTRRPKPNVVVAELGVSWSPGCGALKRAFSDERKGAYRGRRSFGCMLCTWCRLYRSMHGFMDAYC